MRTAILLRDLSNGGIQASAMKLISRMPEISDVFILEDRNEYELPCNTSLHVLNQHRFGGRLSRIWRYLSSAVRLAFLLKKNKVDVVMSFGFSMNTLAVLSVRLLMRRPKVICGIRNSSSEYRDHANRWSLLPWLVPITSRWADVLVANSDALRSELLASGIAPEKVLVIHNGYDLKQVQAQAETPQTADIHINNSIPTVVFVGRLSAQKNIPLLLNAFRLVLQATPAKLVMVGDGEERENVVRMIQHLELAPHVDCVGKQGNPYPYMKTATVLALSSSFEGFPNVLVEAMACGTPVVAVNCPHGPEEILSEGGGLLVPANNPVALAEALVNVLRDPALRERLHSEALKRAADFDISMMISRTRSALCGIA